MSPLPPRILLDTNVWSRVAEADAGLSLRIAANRCGARIVAAPSVLYELTRIPVSEKRRRALRLITEPCWQRPMPEAYTEAEELIAAVRRHRPDWLIPEPQLQLHDRLVRDWKRRNTPAKRKLRSENKAGVWERARNAPALAASSLAHLEGDDLERARAEAKAARQEILLQEIKSTGCLPEIRASYSGSRPGWRGEPFQPWRAEALDSLQYYLSRADGAYRDWIAPFVDLRCITMSAWTEFWLYEIKETEAPRQWLRWAFRHLQRFRKVSPGTPCDIQLAMYLPDVDVLATADGQLTELVQEVAPHAPTSTARAVQLPSGSATVPALLAWLDSGTPSAGLRDAGVARPS